MKIACNDIVTPANLLFQCFRFFVLARSAKDEEYFGQLNEFGCPYHPHLQNRPKAPRDFPGRNCFSHDAEEFTNHAIQNPNPNPNLHAP